MAHTQIISLKTEEQPTLVNEQSIKWLSTAILPPLEVQFGKLEVQGEMIEYIPPSDNRPWITMKQMQDHIANSILLEEPASNKIILEEMPVSEDDRISPQVESTPYDILQASGVASSRIVMPETESDRREAFRVVQRHKKLRQLHLKKLREEGLDAILNNAVDAVNPEVLTIRHADWVKAHNKKMTAAQLNHVMCLEKKEQYILCTTTEYRRYIKEQKRLEAVKAEERKCCAKIILAAAASNMMLEKLKQRWEAVKNKRQVGKFVDIWKARYMSKKEEIQSGRIISQTLHEMSLISLSGRFAIGLRYYVKCVRIVQRRIRFKLTQHQGRFEVLIKWWNRLEKPGVQEHDYQSKTTPKQRKLLQARRQAASSKKLLKIKRTTRKGPMLTFDKVPDPIRDAVLKKYLRDAQREFYQKYMERVDNLWPILVQLMQEKNPTCPRSETKRQAKIQKDTFKMSQALYQLSPSMTNEFPIFTLRLAPMEKLLQNGRELAFPESINPIQEEKPRRRRTGRGSRV